MNPATLARAYGSRTEHLLVVGTKTTYCGKDATLMARYSPKDNRVDSRIRPVCLKCEDAA